MSSADSSAQPHERLHALLPSAVAESCQVIATFLDIRGFSSFSAKGESFDSALYLRSVYSTILDKYFADVNFFKPTGDGLLLVHELPPDAAKVRSLVNSVLGRCLALVDDFGQLTDTDIMVNFPAPQRLGVGIARGSVTRLVSDRMVLDYTGRCLNLAARLMDKARPFGVVFSDKHALALMEPEVAASFKEDRICIRGISEQEPLGIYITRGVEITASDREPVTSSLFAWGEPETLSVEKVRGLDTYGFWLPRAPHSYEVARVDVQYPIFDDEGKRTGDVSQLTIDGNSEERPNGFNVYISMERVIEAIKDLPASTTTRFLERTKKTNITFIPFCGPIEDD